MCVKKIDLLFIGDDQVCEKIDLLFIRVDHVCEKKLVINEGIKWNNV